MTDSIRYLWHDLPPGAKERVVDINDVVDAGEKSKPTTQDSSCVY
jgi:hypothetical protein